MISIATNFEVNMQLQDFTPAIEKLKNQLETDPDNIQLLLQLVELYLKTEGDEYYHSVITLDKILELDPLNFAANRIRGLIYKELDNEEEAIKCFEIIMEKYAYAKEHPEYREIRFDYAELLEQVEREDEALEIFESLDNEKPNDIAVLFKLAHMYAVIERYEEAVNNYKKILELDPGNEAALSQLVDLYEESDKKLYFLTKAELAMKEGNINRAIGEYRKMLGQVAEPEDECDIHIKIAFCHFMQEDFNNALDAYNLALDIDESNPDAYKGLGKVYFETEEYEAAIDCFNNAIELNENDYGVYVDLADCYIELEKYPEAIRELETVKQYMPDDMDVRCSLAEGYVLIRDLYKAKQEINYILARDAKNTRALGALVDLNIEKEDFESALEVSKQIVKLIPNSAYSSRKLAETYEALEDDYNAHYNYGLSYELQSEYGMAIDEYELALEIQPDNAELIMKIGDIYICMGEKFIGIEYYERAADANKENSAPLKKLAEFYLDNGEIDRATDAYSRLVEIDKRDSDAFYNLAVLYEKQKFLEDALEAFYTFLELAPNSTKADKVAKRVEKLEKKLGRRDDEVYEELDGEEYEEYIDERTILQKIVGIFKK